MCLTFWRTVNGHKLDSSLIYTFTSRPLHMVVRHYPKLGYLEQNRIYAAKVEVEYCIGTNRGTPTSDTNRALSSSKNASRQDELNMENIKYKTSLDTHLIVRGDVM